MPQSRKQQAARQNFETQSQPEAIMPRDRAEQFCMMLAIHMEYGRWEHMHRVLDHAQRSVERDKEDATGPDTPVSALGLEQRTVNALELIGVFTLGQLLATPVERIREGSMVGPKTIDEIQTAARRHVDHVMPGTVSSGKPN